VRRGTVSVAVMTNMTDATTVDTYLAMWNEPDVAK
jgi:hypothetical protein